MKGLKRLLVVLPLFICIIVQHFIGLIVWLFIGEAAFTLEIPLDSDIDALLDWTES